MSNMSKELLREYIKEQNFTSPNEILNALNIRHKYNEFSFHKNNQKDKEKEIFCGK